MTIPALQPYEGSYAIVSIETGKAVSEMFRGDKRLPFVNTAKYRIVPIAEWLGSLNA